MGPTRAHVLLADDDQTFREVMSAELTRRGYDVATAADGRSAVEQALAGDADVLLLDLHLPDIDGIAVLEQLQSRDFGGHVIMLTGHGTIDTAIQAIRLGAYDYLEKPCPMEQVEVAIQQAHDHLRLARRRRVLEDAYTRPDVGPDFIGESPAFAKIRRTIAKVAAADSTALILGETGAGKEIAAKVIHAQSARRDGPFVVMDCAALHDNLLHSELFGHEKGAFTGAARQRHGLFEVAHGGTLFLDEVGDTTPEIQAKLLRVLETSRFRRLGGTREIQADVRLVSATNRDLRQGIARGHFREDLFFRLSTVTIQIPPLRERQEDIPLLVEHFLRRLNARFGRSACCSPAAMSALQRYRWPGNVRELLHALEQSVVLCGSDTLEPQDLPAAIQADASHAVAPVSGEWLTLRELEKRHVLAVLAHVGDNRAQAARILGISERHVYRLLHAYAESDSDSGPTDQLSGS